MPYATPEDLLTQIRDELIQQLPGRLAAIEAEYGDGIPLPPPHRNAYFIVNNVDTIPVLDVYPCIVLLGYSESTLIEGEQEWDLWESNIAIRLYYEGMNPERLNKAIYRYARAIVSILRQELSQPSGLTLVAFRVDYSAIPEAKPYFQCVEISFVVRLARSYE